MSLMEKELYAFGPFSGPCQTHHRWPEILPTRLCRLLARTTIKPRTFSVSDSFCRHQELTGRLPRIFCWPGLSMQLGSGNGPLKKKIKLLGKR